MTTNETTLDERNGDLARAEAIAAAVHDRCGSLPRCIAEYIHAERSGDAHLFDSIESVLTANHIPMPPEHAIEAWMVA